MNRFGLPATSIVAAAIGIFAPVSVTRAARVEPAVAECDTCCRQTNAICVVCGGDECAVVYNHYHGKVGSGGCEQEIT